MRAPSRQIPGVDGAIKDQSFPYCAVRGGAEVERVSNLRCGAVVRVIDLAKFAGGGRKGQPERSKRRDYRYL